MTLLYFLKTSNNSTKSLKCTFIYYSVSSNNNNLKALFGNTKDKIEEEWKSGKYQNK